MIRRFAAAAVLSICALSLPALSKRFNHAFHPLRFAIHVAHHPEWDAKSRLSEEELTRIFSEPFHYIDRGAQVFVYASHDNEYVLKLIFSRSNIQKTLEGCRIALESIPDLTGVVYSHLNQTDGKLPQATLIGPGWQRKRIELDHFRFALQRRVQPCSEVLLQAVQMKDKTLFFKKLDLLLATLKQRIAHGIYNSDHRILSNFGFIDDRAVEIDFGNFCRRNRPDRLNRYAASLLRWVETYAPEWKDEAAARFEAL